MDIDADHAGRNELLEPRVARRPDDTGDGRLRSVTISS